MVGPKPPSVASVTQRPCPPPHSMPPRPGSFLPSSCSPAAASTASTKKGCAHTYPAQTQLAAPSVAGQGANQAHGWFITHIVRCCFCSFKARLWRRWRLAICIARVRLDSGIQPPPHRTLANGRSGPLAHLAAAPYGAPRLPCSAAALPCSALRQARSIQTHQRHCAREAAASEGGGAGRHMRGDSVSQGEH